MARQQLRHARGIACAWSDPRLGSLHTGIHEPTQVLRDVDVAQAGGVAQGDAVQVAGKPCTVISVAPDGTGFTTPGLRETHA